MYSKKRRGKVNFIDRKRQFTRARNLLNSREKIRLHLGCGLILKKGWVNIDIDPRVKPDLIASVDNLYMLPDNTVDEIEHNHLFEHLTPYQAEKSIKEWFRVLKPGGVLEFEFPNLARCIEILANKRSTDDDRRLAMIGIYGWPNDFEEFDDNGNFSMNVFQMHKWGWTPEGVIIKLKKLGFKSAKRIPETQKKREAYRLHRDMRIKALK